MMRPEAVGNELTLHKSSRFDEASDGYVHHFRTSFDNGTTWNDLPHVEGNYTDRPAYEYRLAGSTVVQKINVTTCPLDGHWHCDAQDRNYEIWTLDATAHSPSWVLRTSFTIPYDISAKLYTHPTIGTIAWSAHYNNQNHAEVSTDGGATWSTFDPQCEDPVGGETQYTIDQAPHIANITCDAVNTQVCNGPQAIEVQAQYACEPFINQGECNEGLTCYSITGGALCLDLSSTTGVPADAASCSSPDDCEEGQACITLQAGGNFCVREC